MPLALDTQAPDFELSGTPQMAVKLSDYKGRKNVVLTFYEIAFNEDDTVHVEAFRDLEPDFDKADAQILAVSLDPVGIALAFAATSNVEYPLLSDHMDHAVCIAYDAWRTDRGYAAKDGGGMARRVTYIIDKQGKVRGLVPDSVSPAQQAEAALNLVRKL
jgi:peroxiredoxin